MTERTIFLAAIDIADPAKRAAYLSQACGGDADLRAQVDALLSSHQQSSQFLETPAAAGNSAAEMTLVGHSTDDEDDDPKSAALSGEAEVKRYLQPATRPGWLGRLAHYEVEQILGRGAFGIVVKAFDEKLHRVVAIKLMNPDLAATSAPRKRFLREARTAAAVRHENIVGIYAVEEEPLPYLVMEYIPGITLQQRLDQDGPLDLPEILKIGQQVAAGLAAAHAANLIHRDIKPSNILLEGGIENRAKISDFGLARAVDDASMTSSGLIAGTPMYMAPEQARGEVLDHRADLFSLGSVLYQMTSGRPPFRASNTVAVLKRVCEDTPRPIQDVIAGTPDWLCTIINRLLEKKPADRFQTAKEVSDLFARCQAELQLNGKVTCVQSSRSRETSDAPSSRSRETSDRTLTSPATPATPAKSEVTHLPSRSLKRPLFLVAGIIAVVAIIAIVINNNQTPDPASGGRQPSGTPSEISNLKSQISNPSPSWHGWPADAPPPAIAPFNAEQAQQHQEAWAKYLGVPVEYTNSLGMKFRLIPPGEFMMGSTKEEIEKYLATVTASDWVGTIRSQGPQHRVILTQPFYQGETEVTQSEYKSVMNVNPSQFCAEGGKKDMVAGIDTSSHPVDTVSWNESLDFCERLSRMYGFAPFYSRNGASVSLLEGTGYRLPTEAEWEYACRAGTTTTFSISDKEKQSLDAGWSSHNSVGRTHAVRELMPNPFGLYDVHGNVYEICWDYWSEPYYANFQDIAAVNPSGPATATYLTHRVVRGGGYFSPSIATCSSWKSGMPVDA